MFEILQRIYEQGGRSFWIHNTGPIGCLPVNLFYNLNPPPGYLDDHGCVKGQNDIAIEFNRQLKDRVIKLRAELPQAAITYVDVYAAKYGLISNAKTEGTRLFDFIILLLIMLLDTQLMMQCLLAGFADPMKVCCGYHVKYDHVWCGNKGMVNGSEVYGPSCQTPSSYISWDGVHYTQGANQWVANHILNGSLSSNPPTPITQACHRS